LFLVYDVHRTLITIVVWGPTFTGLAVVPLLPYLFDHPVETATELAFKWIEEKVRESREAASLPPKTDL
jgi:mitochondrial fission process protein 1